MALVAINQGGDFGLECLIALIGEWSVLVWVTLPQDLVPESVELLDLAVVGEREGIGTLVTRNVLVVEPVLTVEGLVDVTNVVDEETESK